MEVGPESRIPLVYADPDRVLEVLINLIANAIKFTPPGRSVLVKACLVGFRPEHGLPLGSRYWSRHWPGSQSPVVERQVDVSYQRWHRLEAL